MLISEYLFGIEPGLWVV